MKTNRIGNFLYNLDRTVASLRWGTSQETISSMAGRIARGEQLPNGIKTTRLDTFLFRHLGHWLDTTPKIWGVDHTAKAIQHADALDKVDDGKEQ